MSFFVMCWQKIMNFCVHFLYSHAISAYLVGKYGKDDALYPKDLQKRAIVDQRLHFDTGVLFPRLFDISVRENFYNFYLSLVEENTPFRLFHLIINNNINMYKIQICRNWHSMRRNFSGLPSLYIN